MSAYLSRAARCHCDQPGCLAGEVYLGVDGAQAWAMAKRAGWHFTTVKGRPLRIAAKRAGWHFTTVKGRPLRIALCPQHNPRRKPHVQE